MLFSLMDSGQCEDRIQYTLGIEQEVKEHNNCDSVSISFLDEINPAMQLYHCGLVGHHAPGHICS